MQSTVIAFLLTERCCCFPPSAARVPVLRQLHGPRLFVASPFPSADLRNGRSAELTRQPDVAAGPLRRLASSDWGACGGREGRGGAGTCGSRRGASSPQSGAKQEDAIICFHVSVNDFSLFTFNQNYLQVNYTRPRGCPPGRPSRAAGDRVLRRARTQDADWPSPPARRDAAVRYTTFSSAQPRQPRPATAPDLARTGSSAPKTPPCHACTPFNDGDPQSRHVDGTAALSRGLGGNPPRE